MSTAVLFSIFLIGIASNLDNAGVGIAYGIRKIRISWLNNFIIAFFGFLFTLLAGFLGIGSHYLFQSSQQTLLEQSF